MADRTAQDYQQWFENSWASVGSSVEKVEDSVRQINNAYSGWFVAGFRSATHEGNPDGLPRTADAACQLVGEAKRRLEALELTGEQREVARPEVNDTMWKAIISVDRLLGALSALAELARCAPNATSILFSPGRSSGSVFEKSYELGWDYYPTDEEDKVWQEDWPNPRSEWATQFGKSYPAVLEEYEDAEGWAEKVSRIPDEDLIVSRPERAGLLQQVTEIDKAVVDNWNEVALKALTQGTSTGFYEVGGVVIIDAKQGKDQPYLEWAKKLGGARLDAKITMTKKGGAFDSGKITVFGVQDEATFEAAIKRVSNKKVEFQG
jgi:hypothetical protein